MEFLKLSEIAEACNGSYNYDGSVNGVCIDTRKIQKGCLFICIKGERFDAHKFAQQALDLGAEAVMIDKSVDLKTDAKIVKVANTSKALLTLSGYYRSKFDLHLIGLTGSVGKTTTKEFTYLVASEKYNTVKTLGNLNNEIGLPQMLFHIDNSTEAAVIEMGMNHFGEIDRLSRAAKPNVGVITNVGVSHIENLGSREGILKAKLEITNGLEKGSPLILNGDNDLLSGFKSDDYKVIFFGIENGDFKARDIESCGDFMSFVVDFYGESQKVKLSVTGIHNVYNALAAFAVGQCIGVSKEKCAEALMKYKPEGMRQRLVEKNGIKVIEDCYNASPDSMKAALDTLSGIESKRKIAVLADMLELGDYSKEAHKRVGELAAKSNIDYLFAYGSDSKYIISEAKKSGLENSELFEDKQKLANRLTELLKDGDAVIFKGSRGMALEDVIKKIYEVKSDE